MTGEEIAVIGLGGRFPGADDVATLWQNLVDAVDCVGRPVTGVHDFDAEFFRFDAAEAARIDPQHRIFLETSWRAIEDSGYDVTELEMPVGVFASASLNQYLLLHLLARHLSDAGPAALPEFAPPYQSPDYLPAQVAYRLNLTGPTMAVQSACSGSLVAVCLAAQSLADYRCDMALAGGSNVTLPGYDYGHLASPDGRCRAFDARGEGSGFSSGAGAVVLRRLADAEADGDRIYAVLRGCAVTNDGARRAGFGVPGVEGQAAAIAEALAVAEVEPGAVGFIEAHGSGTPLGDAIEVAALRRSYHELPGPVALGSIKTNIGHLDAAAGIAGLIKAVLAVHHGQVPANLHFEEPNPHIDFGSFFVPTKTEPWRGTRHRVAAVSAFGLGGTNAHVLVSEPPDPPAGRRPPLPPYAFRRRRCWIDPPEVAPR